MVKLLKNGGNMACQWPYIDFLRSVGCKGLHCEFLGIFILEFSFWLHERSSHIMESSIMTDLISTCTSRFKFDEPIHLIGP